MDQSNPLSLINTAWAQAFFAGVLLVVLAFYGWDQRRQCRKVLEEKDALSVAHGAVIQVLNDKIIELLRAAIESDNKMTSIMEKLVDQQRSNAAALDMLRTTMLTRGREPG